MNKEKEKILNNELYNLKCPNCKHVNKKTCYEYFKTMYIRCDGCGLELDITAEEKNDTVVFKATILK